MGPRGRSPAARRCSAGMVRFDPHGQPLARRRGGGPRRPRSPGLPLPAHRPRCQPRGVGRREHLDQGDRDRFPRPRSPGDADQGERVGPQDDRAQALPRHPPGRPRATLRSRGDVRRRNGGVPGSLPHGAGRAAPLDRDPPARLRAPAAHRSHPRRRHPRPHQHGGREAPRGGGLRPGGDLDPVPPAGFRAVAGGSRGGPPAPEGPLRGAGEARPHHLGPVGPGVVRRHDRDEQPGRGIRAGEGEGKGGLRRGGAAPAPGSGPARRGRPRRALPARPAERAAPLGRGACYGGRRRGRGAARRPAVRRR